MQESNDQGKLIVFEGCDDVGKSTIVSALAESLSEKKYPVRVLAFPGNEVGTLGKWVYDFHHSDSAKNVSQAALQSLHISAHIDCIETIIQPLLAGGNMIVLDRYWWSTWVYGTVSGISEACLQKMIQLELEIWCGRIPDILIHVRRKASESKVAMESLASEYSRLATRESEKYPVVELQNNNTVDDAIQRIENQLAKLNIL